MSKRTYNTLYMLSSLDGKISTGSTDVFDFDKDLPKIKGVKEGLNQYYEIEKWTDVCSLNSGRVWAKLGINKTQSIQKNIYVTFVVIDNEPHLTKTGVINAIAKGKKLILVTTNKKHPAFQVKASKNELEIIFYKNEIDFKNLFEKLNTQFGFERVTIQTGGNLNSHILRKGLIDTVSIVVAPVLIGGDKTSTLIDGQSLTKLSEINLIKPLVLEYAAVLKNSYLHLKYRVLN